jgi:hypothetical protein
MIRTPKTNNNQTKKSYNKKREQVLFAGLLQSFYDVVPKLGLHRTRNLPLPKLKSGFLEFLNHLAASEFAEVSAFLPRRTKRDLLGDGAEFFTLVETGFDVFGFCFCFNQYVVAVNFG